MISKWAIYFFQLYLPHDVQFKICIWGTNLSLDIPGLWPGQRWDDSSQWPRGRGGEEEMRRGGEEERWSVGNYRLGPCVRWHGLTRWQVTRTGRYGDWDPGEEGQIDSWNGQAQTRTLSLGQWPGVRQRLTEELNVWRWKLILTCCCCSY